MTTTAERREFRAEVAQLLDIVIHSLYSNKDIFLRELISNASDALDKLRFESLTTPELRPSDELHIRLERDTERRTLSIIDNGIGMNPEEVEQNIGTIAKSGTAEFLRLAKEAKHRNLAPDLIGQFGVGFYSSFMVADRVTLISRRAGEDRATKWESAGSGWYTITETERETCGTTVTLHLKTVDGESGIKDYVDEWVLRDIVKRYSDFVAYPIKMKVRGKQGDTKDAPQVGPETDETLNSTKAIWTRPQSEVTDEEYAQFYKHLSHDWEDPLTHIASKMEGGVEARALLFIPSRAPFDLYHQEMSYRGLQLYVKRVFIMDECRDLMPRHLRFIKGVVDAEDLSLNVSRELLQQDRQITAIRRFLVRKVLDTLHTLAKDGAEKYSTFWSQFGPVIKEGLLGFDDKKEQILDLIRSHSTHGDHPVSLADYVGRMKPDQKAIYYLWAPSLDAAKASPHLELYRDRGYEVLLFTDPVDEVWLQMPPEYQGHQWRSVGKGDVDIAAATSVAAEHTDLLAALRERLGDQVKDVRLSHRLTTSPTCLVGDSSDLSQHMIEMLRRAGQDVPDAKRTLELNPEHAIVQRLRQRFDEEGTGDWLDDAAQLLYGQAVLAEGGQLDDPAAFGRRVADLMTRTL
jgi:molecular chaperone HtpG